MIFMADGTDGGLPAVELSHLLDPLDYDGGPLQLLALRSSGPVAEQDHETVSVPVSDVVSTLPDAGYPFRV